MNFGRFPILLVSLLLLSGLSLIAQGVDSAERLIQLKQDTANLEIRLKLDRTEYLAGEEGELTISIVNYLARPLEVLEPFNIKTGGIDLKAKDPSYVAKYGTEWWYVSPHPYAQRAIGADAPSLVLQPGTRLERRFRLSEGHFGLDMPILRGMPGKPGEYRLVYSYGGSPVEFRIVTPKLENWVGVPLQRPALLNDKGVAREFQRFIAIVAVEDKGDHFIVASRCCAPLDMVTDSAGRLTEFAARAIAPYVRVARSSKPITFIGAVADTAERLTLVWVDKDKESFSLRLDPERLAIGKVQKLPLTLDPEAAPKVVLGPDERPMLEYSARSGQRTRVGIP